MDSVRAQFEAAQEPLEGIRGETKELRERARAVAARMEAEEAPLPGMDAFLKVRGVEIRGG